MQAVFFLDRPIEIIPLDGDSRRRTLPFIGLLTLDDLVVVILERDVRMPLVEVKLKAKERST